MKQKGKDSTWIRKIATAAQIEKLYYEKRQEIQIFDVNLQKFIILKKITVEDWIRDRENC